MEEEILTYTKIMAMKKEDMKANADKINDYLKIKTLHLYRLKENQKMTEMAIMNIKRKMVMMGLVPDDTVL